MQPSVTSRLTEREVETTVAAKKVENAKKVQFRAVFVFSVLGYCTAALSASIIVKV